MRTVSCIFCGVEFQAATLKRKVCPDCYLNQSRSVYQEDKRKDKHNPNQRLIDAVHEATIKGLSYGQYMGRKV